MSMKPFNVSSPIGVFDAGPGGLAVLKYLKDILPSENVLYLGDTARQPYGPQPLEKVRTYTLEACRYLIHQGVKAVLIGCNTATVAGLEACITEFSQVPILGMIQPAVNAALMKETHRVIGVWGTELTVESHAYRNAFFQKAPAAKVVEVAPVELLHLAEKGQIEDKNLIKGLIRQYLRPFESEGVKQLVFGCTDLTCVRREVEEIAGPGLQIIDPAEDIIYEVYNILKKDRLLNQQAMQQRTFEICITGKNLVEFRSFARGFLGLDSLEVKQVSIV